MGKTRGKGIGMASIIRDPDSACSDDHLFIVDDGDTIAWVKVGDELVYIRRDGDGTLIVRVMPDNDDMDALYGEIIVPPTPT